MSDEQIRELTDFDREHLWHPYTSLRDPAPVYPVCSASGAKIRLCDGRELVDGMASWWCVIHGYNNPVINEAITRQLQSVAHVMFGGLTHAPAVELGRRLVELLPGNLDKIFYCDSGSVAVEVAIKMALQYHHAKGDAARKQIATIRGGYHGDTWHAMSVCDPVGGMHSLYTGRLPVQHFAPRPGSRFGGEWNPDDLKPLAAMLEEHHERIAAVIIEPVVQGAGGMWFYHPEYLRGVRNLCTQYGILLIADEIATGFGRTGRMFGCDHAGIVPDIMCLGKAITGGYMSFAAVAASHTVGETISAGSPSEFMHGPTFMGNPLACAAACASLDLLKEIPMERVDRIGKILEEGLAPARALPAVADVRTIGAIGVVEMRERVDMDRVQRRAMERGVWVRPFGKLVYAMPPYIVTDAEAAQIAEAILYAIH